MRQNLEKVVNLFQPNCDGFSEWVEVGDVINAGLKWSSNGNVRRGVVFGTKEYNWEFKRKNGHPNGSVLAMRLAGYNFNLVFSQSIRKDIVDKLRKQTKSNFAPDCIIPLVDSDKEIDHRWGRKDSPKYEYVSNVNVQSIDDFQLLSHSHNQFKREQCLKCKNTNIRYSPPNGKSFVVGCEKWESDVGCHGCPLAQPELYR